MSKTILNKGKLDLVADNAPVDFRLPSSSDLFSAASNLVPGISSVSGARILLGDKASLQAIPLINREKPWATSAPNRTGPSFMDDLGKQLGSVTARKAGEVISVSQDNIVVREADGHKQKYYLYNDYLTGRKNFIDQEPAVTKGQRVTAGQVLATSNFTDKQGSLAIGTNLTTAIMPYRGGNFEDAFVVTESGAKKLAAEQIISLNVETRFGVEVDKNKYISLFPNKFTNQQLDKIGSNGVIKKGAKVDHGDPLVLAIQPRAVKSTDMQLGRLSKALRHTYNDVSNYWHHTGDATVVDTSRTASQITVNVRFVRPLEAGDKISNFFGAKGTVNNLLSDSQAPTTPDGKPVDVILNSMSVTSRISPEIISALAVGKVGQRENRTYNITPFVEGSSAQKAEQLLKRKKISETESLYDPVTGRYVDVTVGPLYFTRLGHISEDKETERGQGVGYDWGHQPSKGIEGESSKRIGNLATTALLAHGASNVLEDIATVRGTRRDDFWNKLKTGQPLPPPEVPFIFDKFKSHLIGSGVRVDEDSGRFRLLPQSKKDIDKLSSGAITNPGTFRVSGSALSAERGGLFDPSVVGIEGNRYNHIDLSVKVPNPVSEDPLRRILGMTQKQYTDAIADGSIEKKISEIDVDAKKKQYLDYLKSGKKTDRDSALKSVKFLNTLKNNDIDIKDLLLDKVPVIPAQYRPMQQIGDLVLSADVNNLYRDLLLVDRSVKDSHYLPDEEDRKKARLDEYNAVKAVYGFGDPVTQKSKQKGIKGLMKTTLGIKGGSGKSTMFQSQVVNKPVDTVARGVINPDTSLQLDEVGLPQDVVWKTYSPFVMRRLVRQQGVPATIAAKMLEERNELARISLDQELRERPGMLTRDPMLHKHSIQGLFVRPNVDPKDHTVHVHPLITGPLGADFDGDQSNFHVPASEAARKEVLEKMLPSQNLLYAKNMQPAYLPSNESGLGLYLASTMDNKNKPRDFASEDAVVAAYDAGQLTVADRATINGK